MENYIRISIETHLFFSRIMKEHSLFLEAGFPCKDREWIQRADFFRNQFEQLLKQVVHIADGMVSSEILKSGELSTEFTIPAEKRTSHLTGIPINSQITRREQQLVCGKGKDRKRALIAEIHRLNERGIWLLNGLIRFKENILQKVKTAELFTTNYPLLIKHILREAKLYRSILLELKQNQKISCGSLRGKEQFWNQIMMEHALFIRGLLDPTEVALIETADDFAMDYKKLLELAREKDCQANAELTKKSLKETLKYREFKAAGTEGILQCEIASIILPLLADHVLREANHYIRILE